jgi:predicted membrane protein
MRQRTKQRGLTIIGFLLVAAVAIIFIAVGARMVPAYIEFYSIQQSLEKSLMDAKDPTAINDVRRSFTKYIQTDYIDSVNASDVDVQKDGNVVTASVTWARKLHLVGNVSLYLDFEAKASR